VRAAGGLAKLVLDGIRGVQPPAAGLEALCGQLMQRLQRAEAALADSAPAAAAAQVPVAAASPRSAKQASSHGGCEGGVREERPAPKKEAAGGSTAAKQDPGLDRLMADMDSVFAQMGQNTQGVRAPPRPPPPPPTRVSPATTCCLPKASHAFVPFYHPDPHPPSSTLPTRPLPLWR